MAGSRPGQHGSFWSVTKFKDIMTVGDETLDFVAALINIDFDVVSRWAEDKRVGFSTFTDLSQKPEVAELLRAEIQRVNGFLPTHARVVRFANFPKELDPDEGELTRSRKLRMNSPNSSGTA